MVEKAVYLLFTIEAEEEISDRQEQIVCLRGKHIAEYNGVKLSNWAFSPAKLKEEIVNG